MQTHLWSSEEKNILEKTLEIMDKDNYEPERLQIHNLSAALNHQAKAISLYPPITESTIFNSSERNINTLIAALTNKFNFYGIFVIPTKALMGKSFIVGKINFFYMIRLLLKNKFDNASLLERIDHRMLELVLSVLTEEVLVELISRQDTRIGIKERAVKALAEIWDRRTSPNIRNYIPDLANLWINRRLICPVYGTLRGTHEYYNLVARVDDVCRNYLLNVFENRDETWALEEFLFGLSFEDIKYLRHHMRNSNKQCIAGSEIKELVNKSSAYFYDDTQDPLELYKFFNIRKRSAADRRSDNIPGPGAPFEEYYLIYLLSDRD